MKQTDMDILKEATLLKQMPYSVPEGYFDGMKENLKRTGPQAISRWNRLVPYMSVAAMFIFLISVGTLIFDRTSTEEGMTQEDYLLFSDNMMISAIYEFEEGDRIAEAGIADEDIIEYLIYSGITAEEIELSK